MERVGVVGCGLMGSGIAEIVARAGANVMIVEQDAEAMARGRQRIEKSLARAVAALETAFMGYIEDRRAIPDPSSFKRGPCVALPALTEAKLALYSAMRTRRIGKTELARRLNCHLPQVDPLLNLRHG